tara:strand:+ start:1230 stop:1460 length:231 start_codon:yes stop_codon:yes gene_type:complete
MPLQQFSLAFSDMTNVQRPVIVDVIMSIIMALTIGSFVILAFNAYRMSAMQVTWTMGSTFFFAMMAGLMYRRLSEM